MSVLPKPPHERPARSAGAPAAPSYRIAVQRESDVPQVVAAAHRFCTDLGFTPLLAAHVATAASELANNLWMHSLHGGQLVLRLLRDPADPGHTGVELSCSDDGPGIADLELALQEGYSTAGGMGCGLPGVKRLMDEFDIRSAPGRGTLVRACKWAHRLPVPRAVP